MKKILISLFVLILLAAGCTKKPDPVDPTPVDNGLTMSELWNKVLLEEEHAWNANGTNIVFSKEGVKYILTRSSEEGDSDPISGTVSDFSYLGNNEYFFKVVSDATGSVDDYKIDISSLPKSLIVYMNNGTYVMHDKHIEPKADPEPQPDTGMKAEDLLFILAEVDSWTNDTEEFISVTKNGDNFYYMEGRWNSGAGTSYNMIQSADAKGNNTFDLHMTWTVVKEDTEGETEQVPVTVTVTYDPENPDDVQLTPYSISEGTYHKDVNAALPSSQLWELLEGSWESYTLPVPHRFYTENGEYYLEVLGDTNDMNYVLTEYHTSHYRYDCTFEYQGTTKYATLVFNPANPTVLIIDEDEFYRGEQ